jgi:hypothetical protein
MKLLGENRRQAFRRAVIFNCVLGSICLLIVSLLPPQGSVRESSGSNQAEFSACCSRFDRVTVRTQNVPFAQSKAQRRQANLAATIPDRWSGLIQFKPGLARTFYRETIYYSVQTSQPSDRAPPPFTT